MYTVICRTISVDHAFVCWSHPLGKALPSSVACKGRKNRKKRNKPWTIVHAAMHIAVTAQHTRRKASNVLQTWQTWKAQQAWDCIFIIYIYMCVCICKLPNTWNSPCLELPWLKLAAFRLAPFQLSGTEARETLCTVLHVLYYMYILHIIPCKVQYKGWNAGVGALRSDTGVKVLTS